MDFTKDWNIEVNGDYTFFGVLKSYEQDPFHKRWNPATRIRYVRDYEKYILPYLNEKAIADCTKEDFDKIINDYLPEKKKANSLTLNEEIISHMRFLLKIVVKTAAEHGICDNFLLDPVCSTADGETKPLETNKETVKQLRKSFTILEELHITDNIMEDPVQCGEKMGLALMFSLGLRNSEACGITFGDIKSLSQYPVDLYCAWIYKSISSKTGEMQLGGKTANMDRIIPLPSRLMDLILSRRTWLRFLLCNYNKNPTIGINIKENITPENVDDIISSLPIACKGFDFSERCSPDDLSKAAEDLFRRIKFNLPDLSLEDDEMLEREPTAYLFRRNFATHLKILGLSESEIQYIIGHAIEDSDEHRAFFRDEDRLYSLFKKMNRRALIGSILPPPDDSDRICLHNRDSEFLRIQVPQKGRWSLTITDMETENDTEISLECKNAALTGNITRRPADNSCSNTINILTLYRNEYMSAEDKYIQASSKIAAKDDYDWPIGRLLRSILESRAK